MAKWQSKVTTGSGSREAMELVQSSNLKVDSLLKAHQVSEASSDGLGVGISSAFLFFVLHDAGDPRAGNYALEALEHLSKEDVDRALLRTLEVYAASHFAMLPKEKLGNYHVLALRSERWGYRVKSLRIGSLEAYNEFKKSFTIQGTPRIAALLKIQQIATKDSDTYGTLTTNLALQMCLILERQDPPKGNEQLSETLCKEFSRLPHGEEPLTSSTVLYLEGVRLNQRRNYGQAISPLTEAQKAFSGAYAMGLARTAQLELLLSSTGTGSQDALTFLKSGFGGLDLSQAPGGVSTPESASDWLSILEYWVENRRMILSRVHRTFLGQESFVPVGLSSDVLLDSFDLAYNLGLSTAVTRDAGDQKGARERKTRTRQQLLKHHENSLKGSYTRVLIGMAIRAIEEMTPDSESDASRLKEDVDAAHRFNDNPLWAVLAVNYAGLVARDQPREAAEILQEVVGFLAQGNVRSTPYGYVARKAYIGLGEYYKSLQQYENALKCYSAAAESAEHGLAAAPPILMGFDLLLYQGHYEKAEVYLRKAIQMAKASKLPTLEAMLYEREANFHSHLGNTSLTQRALRLAQATNVKAGREKAAAFNAINLAGQLGRNEVEEGLELLTKAEATLEKQGGIPFHQAWIESTRSVLLQWREDYEGGLKSATRAYQVATECGDAVMAASAKIQAGRCLYMLARESEAVPILADAVTVLEGRNSVSSLLQARKMLVWTYMKLGRLDELNQELGKFVDLREKLQRETFYAAGEAQSFISQARDGWADVLLPYVNIYIGQDKDAFILRDEVRARLLSASFLQARLEAKDPRLKELIRVGARLRQEIAEKKTSGLGLEQLYNELRGVEIQLSRVTRTYGTTDSVTVSALQDRLTSKEALIEFASFPDGMHAFVVRKESFKRCRVAGADTPPASLTQDVKNWGREVANRELRSVEDMLNQSSRMLPPLPEFRKANSEAYERLISPLLSELDGVNKLYIVPDGDLNYLSFESLILPDQRYLVEEWEVVYLDSARELLSVGSQEGRKALVMGAALYSEKKDKALIQVQAGRGLRNGGEPWKFLPGSQIEAEKVAGLLGTTPVVGSACTEYTFKQQAPGCRYIHLATHGYVTEDLAQVSVEDSLSVDRSGIVLRDPLLNCGLVFSGVNEQGDGNEDGDLTGLEIAGLDLSSAELIVLAACDTGQGALHGTEGVIGLRRAFKVAGAKNLVLSLWKVSDQGTAKFFEFFYNELQRGAPPARALRLAKLEMIELGGRYSAPYYWAPFVLVGTGE